MIAFKEISVQPISSFIFTPRHSLWSVTIVESLLSRLSYLSGDVRCMSWCLLLLFIILSEVCACQCTCSRVAPFLLVSTSTICMFAHSPIAGHLDGYRLGPVKKTSREQSCISVSIYTGQCVHLQFPQFFSIFMSRQPLIVLFTRTTSYGYLCMCVHMCVLVKAKGLCWVSSSIAFSCIFEAESLLKPGAR